MIFTELPNTTGFWQAITVSPITGNVYACSDGSGGIYKQTAGTGSFVDEGAPSGDWHGIVAAVNGDIYACSYNDSKIFEQVGGIGNFTDLNQNLGMPYWSMAAVPNGNVFADTYGNGLRKQTGGTGDFVYELDSSFYVRAWAGAQNGDLYATLSAYDILRFPGAAAPSERLFAGNGFTCIAILSNGDMYAGKAGGDIYFKAFGESSFVAQDVGATGWNGLAAAPDGSVYAVQYGGSIWKGSLTAPPPPPVLISATPGVKKNTIDWT